MTSVCLSYWVCGKCLEYQVRGYNLCKQIAGKHWRTLSFEEKVASLVAQMVKNPPAMKETQFQSLGQEDPLKGMVTLSSILAWRIPWMEEPSRLLSVGSQRVRHDQGTNTLTFSKR